MKRDDLRNEYDANLQLVQTADDNESSLNDTLMAIARCANMSNPPKRPTPKQFTFNGK